MAESSNYSRSVLCGSDDDYSRSMLGGSDEDYSRSVLGGSDVDYTRSVLGGSDEDYSRSVLGGSDVDYTRSVLGGSDEDYSRSLMGGSDYSRSMLGGSDEDYCRSVLVGSVVYCCEKFSNYSDSVKEYPCEPFHHVIANLASTIDVSTSEDKQSPNIWNLTVVQRHYCVVTDEKNKSVKVVDTRTMCVTSQIQLSDAEGGWSMTSVNDDQVAVSVTLKVRKIDRKLLFLKTNFWKIRLFSVSASGIISDTHESVDVKSAYNGITYSNDRFYAAISSRIDVISKQGQIITAFTNKSFSGLRGIALSNDHNTLYVCSHDNDTVFRLDLNGNVTASYKDLKKPEGITVDRHGYVYVCSVRTRCVHQLNANLSKGQVIIKDVHVCCVFNKYNYRLNLGYFNKIQVYSLI